MVSNIIKPNDNILVELYKQFTETAYLMNIHHLESNLAYSQISLKSF